MISTTYKIITYLIALHYRVLLPKLISKRQIGFILGRKILENNSRNWLAFDKIHQDNTLALFLQLDFKKASNKVDFNYNQATLQAMGLGGKFLTLMQGLIIGGALKIHINNTFSKPNPFEQGICQGCSLAPMLFAISTPPLTYLQAKQENGQMMGVELADSLHIHKRMFVDDLDVLIPTIEQAFGKLKDIITLYKQDLGAKLNIQKSSIILVDLSQIPHQLIAKGCQIQAQGEILKYMGAPVGFKMPSQTITNFCLERVYERISGWQTKHISFTGKLILISQVLQAIPTYHLIQTQFTKTQVE